MKPAYTKMIAGAEVRIGDLLQLFPDDKVYPILPSDFGKRTFKFEFKLDRPFPFPKIRFRAPGKKSEARIKRHYHPNRGW